VKADHQLWGLAEPIAWASWCAEPVRRAAVDVWRHGAVSCPWAGTRRLEEGFDLVGSAGEQARFP
jgi:hypothetical protein